MTNSQFATLTESPPAIASSSAGLSRTHQAASRYRGRRVVLCVNAAWNVLNFRSGLVSSMISSGYEVVAIAPSDEYAADVVALGARFVPLSLSRKGCNPFSELGVLLRLARVLMRERPDVYLGYTIKPNIYGSLVCRALRIPVINNVTGLGAAFAPNSRLTPLVQRLYRWAFGRSSRVFFQNEDDRATFLQAGIVREEQTMRLPGSGIDLAKFAPQPLPAVGPGCTFRFLLVARLLWDKGVGEYVEAARRLRAGGVDVECCLLGFIDEGNPQGIPRQTVEQWHAEGVINYLGSTRDVRPLLASAHCVVLPSYREGVPRSLLEAASLGRPVITTDAVGCRDTVDDGLSGYLVRPRDVDDLTNKMGAIATMPAPPLAQMGLCGRRKMERQFGEQLVVGQYLQDIRSAVRKRSTA
ncbi:MAG: glycosyltransferase family 4 protein [Burkholderiales bacterium]